jgi:hypothetical protein
MNVSNNLDNYIYARHFCRAAATDYRIKSNRGFSSLPRSLKPGAVFERTLLANLTDKSSNVRPSNH